MRTLTLLLCFGGPQLYQLLSGRLRHADAFDGQHIYGNKYGVVSEVDWKRAFALQYWYASPQNCELRDTLPMYDDCWRQSSARESRPPLPPFVERNRIADESVYDTCYYLMWLRYE